MKDDRPGPAVAVPLRVRCFVLFTSMVTPLKTVWLFPQPGRGANRFASIRVLSRFGSDLIVPILKMQPAVPGEPRIPQIVVGEFNPTLVPAPGQEPQQTLCQENPGKPGVFKPCPLFSSRF